MDVLLLRQIQIDDSTRHAIYYLKVVRQSEVSKPCKTVTHINKGIPVFKIH